MGGTGTWATSGKELDVATEQDEQDQEQGEQERELPEHPESAPAETVDALEEQQAGRDPDDGERQAGDDVTENPDTDEMEGLPGPPQGEPGEPSG
jgi:hypothetical protein